MGASAFSATEYNTPYKDITSSVQPPPANHCDISMLAYTDHRVRQPGETPYAHADRPCPLSPQHVSFRYPSPAPLCPRGQSRNIKLSLQPRAPQRALQISRLLTYIADTMTKKLSARHELCRNTLNAAKAFHRWPELTEGTGREHRASTPVCRPLLANARYGSEHC